MLETLCRELISQRIPKTRELAAAPRMYHSTRQTNGAYPTARTAQGVLTLRLGVRKVVGGENDFGSNGNGGTVRDPNNP
jgi:hypothetical protein